MAEKVGDTWCLHYVIDKSQADARNAEALMGRKQESKSLKPDAATVWTLTQWCSTVFQTVATGAPLPELVPDKGPGFPVPDSGSLFIFMGVLESILAQAFFETSFSLDFI